MSANNERFEVLLGFQGLKNRARGDINIEEVRVKEKLGIQGVNEKAS